MDQVSELAPMFKALGDPTRMRIFEFLRSRCGSVAVDEVGEVRPVSGPTVGEVCCHITGEDGANSNVSFHLKELRIAKLISVEKRGKFMVCSVSQSALARLAGYFCQDGGLSCGEEC